MNQEHLFMAGPVIYPLIFCSVLVVTVVFERLVSMLFYPSLKADQLQQLFIRDEWINQTTARGLAKGLQLLFENKKEPKVFRDDLLNIWLQTEKRKLLRNVRFLMLLGTITPLLGLLGTVLGIINMFQNLAHETGPVTPSLLAEGMWEAMVTTALGMLVAIPALVAGQGFSIWANYRAEKMEEVLNTCSLYLEKNDLEKEGLEKKSQQKSEYRKSIESATFGSSVGGAVKQIQSEEQLA